MNTIHDYNNHLSYKLNMVTKTESKQTRVLSQLLMQAAELIINIGWYNHDKHLKNWYV